MSDLLHPYFPYVPKSVEFDTINGTGAGDVTLLTADANHRIKVIGYKIVSAGTTNLTFKSATTAISGVMPLVANQDLTDRNPWGLFQTAKNEALVLTVSGAVDVDGYYQYVLVPA